MCGIAGVFRPAGLTEDERDAAHTMTRSLAHRGPDDERVETAAPSAALGARRLAILDPEHGRQPVWDASQRYCVSLNGEIYNHRRLRQELAANGFPCRTQSDTEVVANLVAWVGVETALERLRGMFALAIFDKATPTLWLARDRMGQKPLYLAPLGDGGIAWCSELGPLLSVPGVQREPDLDALRGFLLWEYIPSPLTPWLGVQKLEPGRLQRFDREGAHAPLSYWSPPVPAAGDAGNGRQWAKSLRGALEVAVSQRLEEADVEVGVLLSGGLDSTTVTALAQNRRSEPLRSFSMAVRSDGFDESGWARQAAAELGTHHTELVLEEQDLGPTLEQISRHLTEPLADSSLIATWKLMEGVAAAGVKCVLSGDGADESFGGYPTITAHVLADRLGAGRWLRPLVGALPVRHEGVTRDYMARRFVAGLGHPWHRRHQRWMGAWLPEELGWQPGTATRVNRVVDRHAAVANRSTQDPAARALYLDQRLYLAEGVLVKVDRASMAHGVEVRSPFLDHFLVELAASIPMGFKVRRGEGKRILKQAVRDAVPAGVLSRKKKGFGTPVGPWLRGPCRALLDGVETQLEDLIPPDTWRRLRAEHDAGDADHRRRLWSGLCLARWREHHA